MHLDLLDFGELVELACLPNVTEHKLAHDRSP
jgi:hypothetical protein